jgi:hypothetical protein
MIKLTRSSFVLTATLLVFLSGCFGSNQETTNSDGSSFADDPSKPFTDVYIEFLGPHQKWAGPQSFTIHVNAVGSAKAKVTLTTGVFKGGNHSSKNIQATSYGLSTEAVREEMARLSAALQANETSVRGCLSPVRVRLIRVDGALITRQGCRGQGGWVHVASEIANHFIESSIPQTHPSSR